MLFSTINTFFVVARRLSATSQKSIQVHSSTVQSVDFWQRSTQGRLSCNSNKISDRNQDHMMSCVLTEATDSCPITYRASRNLPSYGRKKRTEDASRLRSSLKEARHRNGGSDVESKVFYRWCLWVCLHLVVGGDLSCRRPVSHLS